VGAPEEIHVDVRILSATHKDLAKLVAEGKFRQDLFYRINVIEVHVPPLRERTEDIHQLTQQILTKLGGESGHPDLDPAALTALKTYAFPGNVRELENILERALALCENNIIKTPDLRLPSAAGAKTHILSSNPIDIDKGICLEEQLYSLEKDAILKALALTQQNKTAAAKLLGMSFRSLRYRLKKLHLE
jgi:two-component system response regulator PilR (NtrC family)